MLRTVPDVQKVMERGRVLEVRQAGVGSLTFDVQSSQECVGCNWLANADLDLHRHGWMTDGCLEI